MKKVILTLLLCTWSVGSLAAGTLEFSWIKPDPKFTGDAPYSWDIDEYHIYCSAENKHGAKWDWMVTIEGYNTERFTLKYAPEGLYECFVRSYSREADLESINSNQANRNLKFKRPSRPKNFEWRIKKWDLR